MLYSMILFGFRNSLIVLGRAKYRTLGYASYYAEYAAPTAYYSQILNYSHQYALWWNMIIISLLREFCFKNNFNDVQLYQMPTSSATAMSTNSNCCLVATVRVRWSRMCSRVAAMSISLAPLAMRFRTMSMRQ